MDFTLSLAHFCELHGPTSLLCTQSLPAECSTCYPLSSASSTPVTEPEDHTDVSSYFLSPRRPSSSGAGAFVVGDSDRCASCRISLPDETQPRSLFKRQRTEKPALRTKEEIHVCGRGEEPSSNGHPSSHPVAASQGTAHSDSSCHNHKLVYVSGSSPADSEAFSSLRRATVRTLSGEQLPRGQTSGPLWFGDPVAGYTIAYVFRLADIHARGRQRYYALLALAGSDTTRAFEACTTIWNLFEQIAMHIVRSAEAVAHRSSPVDGSPPPNGQITPVSSFLTGRMVDPDGFPRRGVASVRANGIADLVDNENFFCELHMIFVGMLQELGRMLGGMKVRPAEIEHGASTVAESVVEEGQTVVDRHAEPTAARPDARFAAAPAKYSVPPDDEAAGSALCQTPLCSPGFVDHRQQVAV